MFRRIVFALSAITLLFTLGVHAQAKEITVRGKLKKTVEAGGWLVASEKQKYLILNPQKFQNEKWFAEGAEVEATGEEKPGTITIYMEGTPFEVHSMRPTKQEEAVMSAVDAAHLTRVLVTGDSTVQAQPDTAILIISVVTQNKRALDAQQDNANRTDAAVRAVKSAAGTGAEIKTGGYSLQPQRVYKENQPPTITGYEARNSVTVTLSDLTKVGAVIDAAAQAGANDVSGISFTLRKDRAARDQALQEATREALNKARVVAQALGGKVVRITEVQEEGFFRPRPLEEAPLAMARRTVAAAPTPIELGTLDITSRVQLIAEIEGS